MDLNTFLDHFDTIAEAPGGIAKLKALILDLAVQGKLVPQNSEEEPASVLLDKSKFEKEQWLKLGKIRKSKSLPPIDKEELPYQSPQGWQWCRFSNVVFFQEGPGIRNWQFRANGIKLLNVKNLVQGELVLENSDKYISEEEFNQKYNHFLIEDGDLLFASSGNSWGKTAFFKNPGYRVIVNTSTIRMRFFVAQCSDQYLRYFLDSDLFKRQMQIQLQGIQPNFGSLHLTKVLLPLPPLAEQKRIVEKADELMALCDRLSTAKQTRDDLRQKLRESTIAALMNAETDEALEKSWAIVRDNWHTLSQDPKDVDDLRRSVLQLAVKGNLVPQYSEDGEAKYEVEEIFKRTKELEKLGKLSRQKASISLPEELPYQIHPNWSWVRFVKVASIESNLVKPNVFGDYPHIAPNYIEKETGRLLPYKTIAQDQVTSPKHHFYPGQIIYSKIRPNLNKLVLVDFEGLCSADMYPISTALHTRYLLMFMLSKPFVNQVTSEDNRLAMPKVNQEQLSQVLVAVPPLAEQKRIVAKVDELMQMCDQLEASLRQSQQRAEALAASAISHLTI